MSFYGLYFWCVMASDLIRYDLLVQEALRNVVRKVMQEAARDGLRGDHHFFITFRTKAPGLRLSERMRARYPDEMTIILQHQFWDLAVTDTAFEVGLSFGGVPERLLIPFDALTAFSDPAAEFGLKFELQVPVEEVEEKPAGTVTKLPSSAGPKLADKDPKPAKTPAVALKPKAAPAPKTAAEKAPEKTPAAKKTSEKTEADQQQKDTKIVSIDAFRKK